MSELRQGVDDYVALRRALGYKLTHQTRLLGDFAGYLDEHGADHVSVELALQWATQPERADPLWWAQRLSAVRGLARHLHTLDPRTEIPPRDLLAHRARRRVPHVFCDTEIVSLMAAARNIHSPFRAATYETLIGLLAATGLRVGEAIRLDQHDVDLTDGLLTVRDSKFGKSRAVPLLASTVDALSAYAHQRDVRGRSQNTDSFFVSMTGTRLIHSCINAVFRTLVHEVELEPQCSRRPRPHDLRHTFAVRVLLGWYRSGADVEAQLPSLSTYLGHTKPASTYWYLSAVPELMTIAGERLETISGQPS